ncbi:helix-turn-helix domain-containing protein [Ruania alkalisoli]|uniref:Helix-turn-helix domain-containing protein n=1 Tax=Ruania alkalisoli TaxID=2779775 RepID=A0A7M1SSL4_9MICO|nr:helix-turn-helix domain-containing protein [Ruania alkalisoli]QOR70536.1 helix-turn-helix domain-containing protein [Ruania alkalisoli]
MELTLKEAAARLGVTPRQAQRLARSGRLQIVGHRGPVALVDDTGLARAASARAGRLWSPVTAWAAIDSLQSGHTGRLAGSALSRLRHRLRAISAEELVRLCAGRASLWRGNLTRRSSDQLRAEIYPSGQSLLADPQVAALLGLSGGPAGRTEGYVNAGEWKRTQARFGLEADAEGVVLLRISTESPAAGLVSTAVDLVETGTVRERSAALALLEGRLSQ